MNKYTVIVSFRNGETRTETRQDVDAKKASQFVWQTLPGKDQERNPTITLLTSTEVAS